MLTGRRPAPPPRSSSWTHGRANIPRGIALLRTRRSGMSRLRGHIRRDDDTSEDVQRLETAGNAVFSNRLKRATRFRSTSTSASTSTFDHRLRTGGNAIRVAPFRSARTSAGADATSTCLDRPSAGNWTGIEICPGSVHRPPQFSRGQTFPGGTEFLRGQQGTCARLRFATRVCRGDPRSQLP